MRFHNHGRIIVVSHSESISVNESRASMSVANNNFLREDNNVDVVLQRAETFFLS